MAKASKPDNSVKVEAHKADDGIRFSRQESDASTGPINRATLDAVVARVILREKSNGHAPIVVARFEDLPAPILAAAKKQGYDNKNPKDRIKGVAYFGRVYLVQENIQSELEAEEALLHEATHIALRASQSKSELQEMLGALYSGMGGGPGMVALASQAGVKMNGIAKQTANLSMPQRALLATEEFLAEVEGRRAYEKLPDRAKRVLREFVGSLRNWLREHGFTRLAKRLGANLDAVTLSDLNHLLKTLRTSGVTDGNKVVRFMRSSDGSKAQAKSRNDVSPFGFYSALSRGIGALNYKTLSVDAWNDALKSLVNNGLVKQDEIEWSGLNDFLKMQEGKVSKEQIQEYLDANGVQVQEVTLGQPNEADIEALLNDEVGEGMSRAEAIEYLANDEGATPTKYAQYQLPGGTNYREVLLTLPEAHRNSLTQFRNEMVDKYGQMWRQSLSDVEIEKLENITKNIRSTTYKSSHWEQPNVLAHIRLNDRVDADGKRVLFVEELQSDWGQDGKKKGFAGNEWWVELSSGDKEYYKNEQEANRIARENNTEAHPVTYTAGKVPAAPFVDKTDKWLNLALKRVIKMAVDGGYDKVAFVNGEQSADRYDLSKQVSDIQYTKEANGKYYIVVGGPRGGIHSGEHTASELEDYVGKELAQRIVDRADDSMKELSGLDLKVGGEGMKAFYDAIVPNTVNALLKKVGGGKVETVDVGKYHLENRQGGIYGEYATRKDAEKAAMTDKSSNHMRPSIAPWKRPRSA